MAQYNGYVAVGHSSYDEWRRITMGNGYNVDFQFGNQCWDYCALLYWQYGLTLYTGNGTAYSCWTMRRQANAKGPFKAIDGVTNIRRGDIVVLNRGGGSTNGHSAFADEDYNKSGYINLVGQNQGGTNGRVNIRKTSLSRFLGIFRNNSWDHTPGPSPEPPAPEPEEKKAYRKDFPWPVAWNNWKGFM